MNAVARGAEVLCFKRWPQIGNDAQIKARTEDASHGGRGVLVSCVDHWKLVFATETWPRLRWSDEFRKLHYFLVIAAIGATREEHHVGPQFANALDLFMRLAIVVRSDRVHDDRAGAECCALRTFGGHLPHHTGHHHLQATASRRGRDVDVATVWISE